MHVMPVQRSLVSMMQMGTTTRLTMNVSELKPLKSIKPMK